MDENICRILSYVKLYNNSYLLIGLTFTDTNEPIDLLGNIYLAVEIFSFESTEWLNIYGSVCNKS